MSTRQVPTGIADILSHDDGLWDLMRRADALAELQQTVRGLLPDAIRSQVYVAQVRDRTLVIVTPSAAVASRVRLDSSRILQALASSELGLDLKAVRAKVVPVAHLPEPDPVPQPATPLPPRARAELLALAKELKGAPALRKAVTNLANVGRAPRKKSAPKTRCAEQGIDGQPK